MSVRKRYDLKFIVIFTVMSLSLMFIPGFTCEDSATLDYQGDPGPHWLIVTPSTLIVPQEGSSSKVVLDFKSRTIDYYLGNFRYWTRNVPDGMIISRLTPEPEPKPSDPPSDFRVEYSIETTILAPAIYELAFLAVTVKNDGSEEPEQILDSKTLKVIVVPRGLAGTSRATQIAAGAYHSLAILDDGTVWSWGSNRYGKLGDGTTLDRLAPVRVRGLPAPAVAIAAGENHSLALLDDGTVWGWGSNRYKQIGSNDYGWLGPTQAMQMDTETPLIGVQAIAAGANHSVALTRSGDVWTSGDNASGQLGISSNAYMNRQSWTRVPFPLELPVAVAAGGDFTLALDRDGQVWGWGDNSRGQLGEDTWHQHRTPVEVYLFSEVRDIAAGSYHSLAIKNDGSVLAVGSNSYGQLGVDERAGTWAITVPGLSDIVAIDAGFWHSLALASDGTVYGWGDNSFGQLSFLADSSPAPIEGLSPASAIAAGDRHSLAMVDGCARLLSCGDNVVGQLGNGTGQSSQKPVAVLGIGEASNDASCEVSLAVIVVGGGRVWSHRGGTAWGGIDCDSSCSAFFAPGTDVSLTAEPAYGWKFDHWAGGVAGTEPDTDILMDDSKICIAYFSSEPVPPVALFTASPDYPLTTDVVTLDASESYDNGWIALYEWDFDEDGQFDLFRERKSINAAFTAEFVTESWPVGTHTIRLRVTDNDGMSDETTGVIHVREPERPRYDLGDAPDSSNTMPRQAPMLAYAQTGVIARYPTVYRAGSPPYGPLHRSPTSYFYLGKDVTLENEADVGVDEDSTNNIAPALDSADRDGGDDGIKMPATLPSCGRASMDCTINVVDPPHQYIYVNVWFDWNRDGDWDDVLECPDGSKVREHGVQNEEMYLFESGAETLSFSFKCWHPSEAAASDPMWMRVTVSEQYWSGGTGGSGPADGYEYGETEDYYLQP